MSASDRGTSEKSLTSKRCYHHSIPRVGTSSVHFLHPLLGETTVGNDSRCGNEKNHSPHLLGRLQDTFEVIPLPCKTASIRPRSIPAQSQLQ